MELIVSLVAVAVLFLAGMFGSQAGLQSLFGIVIPYIAFAVFVLGIIYKVMGWAKVPVPFRIPTTCGQQKTLPWIEHDKLDNPFTPMQAAGRMALEVLMFRSLIKNTKTQLKNGRISYMTDIFLWVGALAFHYAFLVVALRHLRLFTDPVPFWVTAIEKVDGFMQVGVPGFYATSFVIIAAVAYLLWRRLASPQLRYISLANDYFPLLLILCITGSGFFLRYLTKTDIVAVKELLIGLVTFAPAIPENPISGLFYGHVFLVSVLLAYFPFSKLMHAPGVFLSPTRNMANNNRAVRHINPWNYPVKVHTYEEYEDELRDLMKSVDLPLEKE